MTRGPSHQRDWRKSPHGLHQEPAVGMEHWLQDHNYILCELLDYQVTRPPRCTKNIFGQKKKQDEDARKRWGSDQPSSRGNLTVPRAGALPPIHNLLEFALPGRSDPGQGATRTNEASTTIRGKEERDVDLEKKRKEKRRKREKAKMGGVGCHDVTVLFSSLSLYQRSMGPRG